VGCSAQGWVPRATRTDNAATIGGVFEKNDTFDSAIVTSYDVLGKSQEEVTKRILIGIG
jgi:hypothetical protein